MKLETNPTSNVAAPRGKGKLVLSVAAAAALLLSGCSVGTPVDRSKVESVDANAKTLRLAHVYDAGHPVEECGVATIKEELQGSGLQVQSFPSAQLGNESELLEQVASGSLDMAVAGPSFLGVWEQNAAVLDAAYLFEANHRVAGFREQPISIAYPDGARLRRYTPDFELTLTSGLIVWVEIKPLSSLARDEVRDQLTRVAEHMARIQQPFVVLDDTLLRHEPRRTNLQTIYHRASPLSRTRQAAMAALRRCSHRLPAGLSTATQTLADMGLEPYGLLLAGALRCDLSAPLTADTVITINQENDDGWFRLSEEFDF